MDYHWRRMMGPSITPSSIAVTTMTMEEDPSLPCRISLPSTATVSIIMPTTRIMIRIMQRVGRLPHCFSTRFPPHPPRTDLWTNHLLGGLRFLRIHHPPSPFVLPCWQVLSPPCRWTERIRIVMLLRLTIMSDPHPPWHLYLRVILPMKWMI